MSRLKSEGFMKVLKTEVELMAMMAKTMDGFSQHQTRLTVVIDGLDSCEQDKVLQMLDTVRVLFSKGPFISIFASDPHIIIKAINQNLNSVLRDSNINGHDYMRNIVHLPLARGAGRKLSQHRHVRRRQVQRSVTRQMSFDLTKLMVTEDWFNDISPQTMRRLLNIVSAAAESQSDHLQLGPLASWINLTEQWPYRTSWIILTWRRATAFEVFLSSRTPVLTARDIRTFAPCTVNLDPKLREIIADVRAAREQLIWGGSRTPPPPCRRRPPAPPPCTARCRPRRGGGPPLPHSSFYSGLAGPQHPFYNRPYFPPHLYQQQRPLMVPHLHLQPLTCTCSLLTCSLLTNREAHLRCTWLHSPRPPQLHDHGGRLRADWQLFRASVLEMRSMESQLLHEEAASEQGSTQAPPPDASIFSFNLSFEDLSSDEPPRAGNTPWTAALRTASLTSLNSQESSSLDVSRLTDRQQDEYLRL
ncbi:hypothetical protein F7725_028374 [Dissostichus mawsoni]|uniref:KAP NTPase domain-containing protein n=1 Tax=Dissostichus mawsoni TaxID=36200 RepID=A0A7J5XFH7_DISMA|nr:hypothetical protein F7725_028374 [Dissostichus mawsoni]